MRCPHLTDLPPVPPGRTGWPWTEETPPLPAARPDGQPWPRLSILTPSLNQADFLEEAIRSVLLQGYPDLEYMVLDGGSTDGSKEIIRRYEPWLAHWVSEPDRGQAHALNKGLSRCNGVIFNWINADDLCARRALAAVGRLFSPAQPQVLAGAVMNLYPDGTRRTVFQDSFTASRFAWPWTAGEMSYHQPGAFLPLAAVKEAGGLPERYHYAFDRLLMAGVLKTCGVVYTQEVLAHFRFHPGAKTSDNAHLIWVELAERVEREFSGLPEAERRAARRWIAQKFALGGARELRLGRPLKGLALSVRACRWSPGAAAGGIWQRLLKGMRAEG